MFSSGPSTDFRVLEDEKREDMFRKICLKSVPFFVEEFHRARKPALQQCFTVYEDAIRRQDSNYALALSLPLKYNRGTGLKIWIKTGIGIGRKAEKRSRHGN
ncbi:hypothetical protein EVAR_35942_1 [Eumeta japonica]|uniref:Uncharacterized protein n=1 Tax=Eumeta variegata TaxID=151549 RepID=A0A4C1W684_EUMVA|nr:hypothetical protein EVAR_35942_1 [Eumeta japonica]